MNGVEESVQRVPPSSRKGMKGAGERQLRLCGTGSRGVGPTSTSG